ncbi:MAG: carbamoyltransferase HypF [Cyclonatronaceae bacterium]
MATYHIHTTGRVQGVGFRPMVCDAARRRGLKGWVRNSSAGLEVRVNASASEAAAFHDEIVQDAPLHAIISGSTIRRVHNEVFSSFEIRHSAGERNPEVLMPPDVALCGFCRADMEESGNRRYRYPFTTCLHCGPRYSIIRSLPYDRAGTTMDELDTCPDCEDEYNRPGDRRQHSQTNSCNNCAIPMHAYGREGLMPGVNSDQMIGLMAETIEQGEIIALKGIGGYLLLADATNRDAISTLRNRKKRPFKPFALMYPDIATARLDARIGPQEEQALLGAEAPVVLCRTGETMATGIHPDLIAPGLDTLGILMPYSPLFYLLMKEAGKPLIATSANITGSPIIYRDEDAVRNLKNLAGLIVTYDREITAPQDDSVVRFSPSGQRIILRRSRGMAPGYFPNPFLIDPDRDGECVKGVNGVNEVLSDFEPAFTQGPESGDLLATGADLKSSFAVTSGKNLFVSQYLGNQEFYDSQCAYRHTLAHIGEIYHFRPETILTDAHPGYFVTSLAGEMAARMNIRPEKIQHHEAHFAAVLAENGLLMSHEPVLGFIWDGTGLGTDGQIWGGEVMLKTATAFERIAHLDYFPVLAGDRMSREPRLSALSLMRDFPEARNRLRSLFDVTEWEYYNRVLENISDSNGKSPSATGSGIMTSSMGRLFDGIASLLGICDHNTYEGEAAGRLEAQARRYENRDVEYYPFTVSDGIIHWKPVVESMLSDLDEGVDKARIASKIFRGLSRLTIELSRQTGIRKLAFSGGVFQNALLIGFILEEKPGEIELYFHRQLSPNDENIGFGQVAHHKFTHSVVPDTAGESHFHSQGVYHVPCDTGKSN